VRSQDRFGLRPSERVTAGVRGADAVHKVLTRTTYIGRHRFNTKYWKTRERKPEAEVVEMTVPPIIDAAEFEALQMRSGCSLP
jgi:Recombinase